MGILRSTNLMITGMLILVVGLIGSGLAVGDEIENLMDNGGFEDGTHAPWQIGGGIKDGGGVGATLEIVDRLKGANVDEDPIEGDLCLLVGVEDGASSAGDVQFMTANHPAVYEKGEIYTLSAFIKSDDSVQFHLLISGGSEDGFQPSFRSETFTATDTWEEYHLTTDPMPIRPQATRAKFFVGYGSGEFWIDDIKVYQGEYVPTSPEAQAVAMTTDKLATTWASIKAQD
ncbi:MAG: carbohydrate binding domain-containing protein [Dehalococcoidia bacterium]|nr:carbohydrate binding domain-containing protein [Dehalococcoidia bacterium]